MLRIKILISMIAALAVLYGEDRDFNLVADVKIGPFQPRISGYTEVYNQRNPMGMVKLGLGFDNGYLIGGYRYFRDEGVSTVSGIEAEGVAIWEERIASIGFRSIEQPFFMDIQYLIASVQESIRTEAPAIPKLANTYRSTDNRGYSLAGGFLLPLLSFLHLNLEAEYLWLPLENNVLNEEDTIHIGGFHVSAGITVKL